jgi:hypothetical protein
VRSRRRETSVVLVQRILQTIPEGRKFITFDWYDQSFFFRTSNFSPSRFYGREISGKLAIITLARSVHGAICSTTAQACDLPALCTSAPERLVYISYTY